MKTRLLFILSMGCLFWAQTFGQLTVYQDEKGQVLTSVDNYSTGMQYSSPTATHTRTTFLGSPFFTFPVWQPGTIQLDKSGKELSCQLAYNLVSNEVLCRFDGDSAVQTVTPEFFTINNTTFIRLQDKVAGLAYRTYFSLLHDGPTRLWMSLDCQLKPLNSAEIVKDRTYLDVTIRGIYRTYPKYYIQRGDRELTLVDLTKKSFLKAFPDYTASLESRIPDKDIAVNDAIGAVTYYDSLVAEGNEKMRYLPRDEAFKEKLTGQIAYPAKAGFQGIYGRVYAGFDVDSLGRIRNITVLSPENSGFSFTDEVKKSLETMSAVSPALRGHYALPVTFTYTNSKEHSGLHAPVNQLPDDRLGNRILLKEVLVPYVTSSYVTTSREVWGYYK